MLYHLNRVQLTQKCLRTKRNLMLKKPSFLIAKSFSNNGYIVSQFLILLVYALRYL